MDLYIIRHGRPNRQVVDDGQGADPHLSDIGQQQAQRTADYLRHEGIEHIVSSTMNRAVQTGEPLAEMLGLEIEQLDDLKESDHRSNSYVPAEEISRDDPATAHYFEGNLLDIVFSDGYDAFEQQVLRGFQHVIDSNKSKRVAVFCHGMVTATFIKTILGINDVFSMTIDYCGLSRIRASSGGVRSVRSFNETHHVRDLIEW